MTVEGVAPAAPVPRRHVAAAVVGNALEFYDFVTYTFFAVQIGAAFFPSHDPFIQQMSSLITFGVGFVTRPIGALVIGRYGDRVGRRPAMMLSFTLMGVAILGLALTPTFAQIGVAAPILVVSWRLIQGFALGGEVGPTTAYLIEAAPPDRRGLYGSFQYASQGFSSLVGGLVGVAISAALGDAALSAWGWRIAFLIGALVLPWGFWLRRTLPETRHRAETHTAAQPAAPTLKGHGRIIVLGLLVTANGTIATYIFNNMTSYAQTTLKMAPGAALAASIVVGATLIVFGLIAGALSDRVGRKPMMLWPRLLLMVAVVPGFSLLAAHPDHTTLLLVTGVLSTIAVLAGATGITAIVESMHRDVRSLAFAGVYSTAVAVFGGTTQPIITWMIKATGDPVAPAWYLVAACAVGTVAILLLPESRPKPAA
ncbi:MAG: MFS transporter [Proteobacteria bacterium]|nr:MFS transporter [Pseudomonadota bacterium]